MVEKDKWYEHNTGLMPECLTANQFVFVRLNTEREVYAVACTLNWWLTADHGLWITHYMVPSYVEMMGS